MKRLFLYLLAAVGIVLMFIGAGCTITISGG